MQHKKDRVQLKTRNGCHHSQKIFILFRTCSEIFPWRCTLQQRGNVCVIILSSSSTTKTGHRSVEPSKVWTKLFTVVINTPKNIQKLKTDVLYLLKSMSSMVINRKMFSLWTWTKQICILCSFMYMNLQQDLLLKLQKCCNVPLCVTKQPTHSLQTQTALRSLYTPLTFWVFKALTLQL